MTTTCSRAVGARGISSRFATVAADKQPTPFAALAGWLRLATSSRCRRRRRWHRLGRLTVLGIANLGRLEIMNQTVDFVVNPGGQILRICPGPRDGVGARGGPNCAPMAAVRRGAAVHVDTRLAGTGAGQVVGLMELI